MTRDDAYRAARRLLRTAKDLDIRATEALYAAAIAEARYNLSLEFEPTLAMDVYATWQQWRKEAAELRRDAADTQKKYDKMVAQYGLRV